MSGDVRGKPGHSERRVWLDVPYADKDATKALGARWDGAARRWFALPGRVDQLNAWAAAPALPDPLPGEDRTFGDGLFVDLIPTAYWLTKLRTCLLPADWGRVKALVVGRTGHHCEVCGTGAEPSRGLWLQAHERWSYDDTTRVQTLRRLVCLCTRCHHTTHVRFSEVTGQGPQAHAHLRAVNQWSAADTDAHIAMAARVWRTRSAVDWSLDLSILTAARVLPSPTPTATERRPACHRHRHPRAHHL